MLVLKCPRSEKGSQSIFTSWWKCDWKYVLNYCYSCLANRYASKSLLQFCGASWSALSFLVFFIRASHATLTAPRNSQILKLISTLFRADSKYPVDKIATSCPSWSFFFLPQVAGFHRQVPFRTAGDALLGRRNQPQPHLHITWEAGLITHIKHEVI